MNKQKKISTFQEFANSANYSLLNALDCDPDAKEDGLDHFPRQVFSGHYVPVKPTPIQEPRYIAHSNSFFEELHLHDCLAKQEDFMRMFSGDASHLPKPLKNASWACGYALSIYGTEYYQQCPFQTGNGYGDGRAISIFEGVFNGKRFEMQLKGGGRTPYCRGADGRAVLRSSIREFLAQEHMHALGIPTSRSLTLYTSNIEKVRRPWFIKGSYSRDPEVMIEEDVAISTRVAPSFLRVGQLELFGRRARKNEHPKAMQELEKIVLHAIDREYAYLNENNDTLHNKIIAFANAFRDRLTSLIANWIRVGYCQGNFNSDNCAVGGFTLDYGPFGFIDAFDPRYQPWTGGGAHFSFFNQPKAAQKNFHMFCTALKPLLQSNPDALASLENVELGFAQEMQTKMESMWASKLGIKTYDATLFEELYILMTQTPVDYTIFFRELSSIPKEISPLTQSFYKEEFHDDILQRWSEWLTKWNAIIHTQNPSPKSLEDLSRKMKLINPKYTLREWFLVPTYTQAENGDYSLVHELQKIMIKPFDEQSQETQEKYYRLKPIEYFQVAGISHISCSS